MVITLYSLLIFLYLAFDDYLFPKENLVIFYAIELAILGLFVIDILLHLVSFRCLYLQDSWNLFDMLIIILCLAFVFLDMFADN
jgi:Ion transport protein